MQFAEALCFLLVLFALPYAAVGRFLRFIYYECTYVKYEGFSLTLK